MCIRDRLDIALIHDYDGVRHGKRLLLVVCDVDEGDTELIFEADKLIPVSYTHLFQDVYYIFYQINRCLNNCNLGEVAAWTK